MAGRMVDPDARFRVWHYNTSYIELTTLKYIVKQTNYSMYSPLLNFQLLGTAPICSTSADSFWMFWQRFIWFIIWIGKQIILQLLKVWIMNYKTLYIEQDFFKKILAFFSFQILQHATVFNWSLLLSSHFCSFFFL